MTTPNEQDPSLQELINKARMERRVLIHKTCGRQVIGLPGLYGSAFYSCPHCNYITDDVGFFVAK